MKCQTCNSDLDQCPEAGDWFCYQCQIDEYNREAELAESLMCVSAETDKLLESD